MKRKRHTPDEIIKKLEVSPPTYHRWRQEYGGAKEDAVKRPKELEKKTRGSKGLWPPQATHGRTPVGVRAV